jgi:hypothetical protein
MHGRTRGSKAKAPLEDVGLEQRDGFPMSTLVLAGVGLPALIIAIVFVLYALGIDGQPDDVVFEFSGYRALGPMDTVVRLFVSTVLGSAGVFCLVKFWRDLRLWQRRHS